MPLVFPVEDLVPESSVHLRVRTALYLVLERELRGKAFVGSDQFLYWDPTDPTRCLAPDIMVRLGMPSTPLRSFETWEHGAPHIAVEVTSLSDSRDDDWDDKLDRYRRCGVAELVRVTPEAKSPTLTLWDLVDGHLVERDLTSAGSRRSAALGAYWVLEPNSELGAVLRLANDPDARDLWLTAEELLERERAARTAEQNAASVRIAELERRLRER